MDVASCDCCRLPNNSSNLRSCRWLPIKLSGILAIYFYHWHSNCTILYPQATKHNQPSHVYSSLYYLWQNKLLLRWLLFIQLSVLSKGSINIVVYQVTICGCHEGFLTRVWFPEGFLHTRQLYFSRTIVWAFTRGLHCCVLVLHFTQVWSWY